MRLRPKDSSPLRGAGTGVVREPEATHANVTVEEAPVEQPSLFTEQPRPAPAAGAPVRLHGSTSPRALADEPFWSHLSRAERDRLSAAVAPRAAAIEKLLTETGGDPKAVFERLFGVTPSAGIELEVRPYGLYFTNDDATFTKLVPQMAFNAAGATVSGSAGEKLLAQGGFLDAVGFGQKGSAGHEFVHMLNTLNGIGDRTRELEAIRPDTQRPTDAKTVRDVLTRQYGLWADSRLKDELLARIENGQIHEAKVEDAGNHYSGDGLLFTTYQPAELFAHISPYQADAKPYGVDAVSREEFQRFDETYRPIREEIAGGWRKHYNDAVRGLQRALESSVSPAKLRAVLSETPFERWGAEISRLQAKSPYDVSG